MRLSRRDLLKALLALPIAASLDVERLLWVPTPQIVVPALPTGPLLLEEINETLKRVYLPAIQEMFLQSSPFLAQLRAR